MKFLPLMLLVFVSSVFAQEPDRWRGLILDEATPERAVEVLGKPKAEKYSDRYMEYRNKSLRDLKDLKILHWEKTQGFADIKLYFTGGTLAIIQLEKPDEKLPAKVFVDAYPGVSFDWGRRPNSQAFYELEATTPKSKIAAGIANVTGSVFGGMLGTNAGRVPKLEGNVIQIFIQSRRVDDKRGVDALK